MRKTFENFGEYLGFISDDLARQRQNVASAIETLRESTEEGLCFEVVRDYVTSHDMNGPNPDGRPYFSRRESFLDGICALTIYIGGPHDEKTTDPAAYSVDLLCSHVLLSQSPDHSIISYRGEGPKALFDELKRKEESKRALVS
ncbi:MAG: hypothetical protein AAB840_00405 [Patescibacteria group bacterium]